MRTEMVVLLNDEGDPVGMAPKATVHSAHTPLHLAFSCYVVAPNGRLLLTRRSLTKKTWAGVWTNSYCGHPAPDENLFDAVYRRAREELDIEVDSIRMVLEDFRYRAIDPEGTLENEICPVFIARTSSEVRPNPMEVVDWVWIEPGHLMESVERTPFVFTPWLREQSKLLREAEAFHLLNTGA